MVDQIDFYILDKTAKLNFACKVVQKAFNQDLKVYLQTDRSDQSRDLDKLLWTFSQNSFIPHKLAEDPSRNWDHYPVQIGNVALSNENPQADILIALTNAVPESYEKFNRVIDLITNDPADKLAGRERYRVYRDAGIEPNTHNIG